jgi:hypothetical protein
MKLNRSWLMALCLVGLGALLILPSLGIGIGTIFGFLLVLLCPLSHFFMMRGGHGGHAGAHHGPAPADQKAITGPAEVPASERNALEGRVAGDDPSVAAP